MGLGSVDGFHPPQGHGRVARQVAPANNNFVVAAKRLLGGGPWGVCPLWKGTGGGYLPLIQSTPPPI